MDENKKRYCDKGFAILLTNEKKYWEKDKDNNTIDKDFVFGDNSSKLRGEKLEWNKKSKDKEKYEKNRDNFPTTALNKTGNPTSRAQPIYLDKAYSYTWRDYPVASSDKKNGRFRFVIIEVE